MINAALALATQRKGSEMPIDDDIPQYAILSHTWGADTDEVTFGDMTNGTGKNKPGYEKIRFCGEQARQDGLQYFWIAQYYLYA